MFEAIALEIIAGIISLILAGLGWLLNRIRIQIKEARKLREENQKRVDTLFEWAFGREEDSTDMGMSGDVEELVELVSEKYEKLSERLEELEN